MPMRWSSPTARAAGNRSNTAPDAAPCTWRASWSGRSPESGATRVGGELHVAGEPFARALPGVPGGDFLLRRRVAAEVERAARHRIHLQFDRHAALPQRVERAR